MQNQATCAQAIAMKCASNISFGLFLSLGLVMAAIVSGVGASAAQRPAPAGGKTATTAPTTQPRIGMKLLSARKIWDKGKHNAFTDLIGFDGRMYCVFREADGHVSPDGKIRILVSKVSSRQRLLQLATERDTGLDHTPRRGVRFVAHGVSRGKKSVISAS